MSYDNFGLNPTTKWLIFAFVLLALSMYLLGACDDAAIRGR